MISFFIANKEIELFRAYLRDASLPDPQTVDKPQLVRSYEGDRIVGLKQYQQVRVNINTSDLLALKLKYDIRHSLF